MQIFAGRRTSAARLVPEFVALAVMATVLLCGIRGSMAIRRIAGSANACSEPARDGDMKSDVVPLNYLKKIDLDPLPAS